MDGTSFAFETTLGGNTISRLLRAASRTHDVFMIYCGLASVEQHIDRVAQRVRQGGHDIPIEKIRQRWNTSRHNLIGLLPSLHHLQVFDNIAEVMPGEKVPYPVLLLLEMMGGQVLHPGSNDLAALKATPDWAKPIVAAALQHQETKPGIP